MKRPIFPMENVIFYQGSIDDLDTIGHLWEKLRQVHSESTTYFKERYDAMNWEDRKHSLLEKSNEGMAVVFK